MTLKKGVSWSLFPWVRSAVNREIHSRINLHNIQLFEIAIPTSFVNAVYSSIVLSLLFWTCRNIGINHIFGPPKHHFQLSKMGNKRNRRCRRLETPSPEREIEKTQVETFIPDNETSTNINTVVQENLGENNSENQLTEPSQFSNEIPSQQ